MELGDWAVGLPNSSSHALIGSITGVGLANQLLSGASGVSGVDMVQVKKVLSALLFSPVVGFIGALMLMLIMKRFLKDERLYREPEGSAPPPRGIRALLIFTCTAVSFAHGGNDGQKGMGLIMLILIGCAPTAYALNRTLPESAMPAFVQSAQTASAAYAAHGTGFAMPTERARDVVTGGCGRKRSTRRTCMKVCRSCRATLAIGSRITARSAACRPPSCPICATTCTSSSTPRGW